MIFVRGDRVKCTNSAEKGVVKGFFVHKEHDHVIVKPDGKPYFVYYLPKYLELTGDEP